MLSTRNATVTDAIVVVVDVVATVATLTLICFQLELFVMINYDGRT